MRKVYACGQGGQERSRNQGANDESNDQGRVDPQKPSPQILLNGRASLQTLQHKIAAHNYESADYYVRERNLPGGEISQVIVIMGARQIITMQDDDQRGEREADH